MLDYTMTATLRPTVLRETLDSFAQHLVGFRDKLTAKRLVVNVDPIGEAGVDPCHILRTCTHHFSHITSRCPTVPDYPYAWKWTWTTTTEEFVFLMFDDFALRQPVDLDAMLAIMRKNPDLAVLRLPVAWHDDRFKVGADSARQWNVDFPWNGEFFECPEEHRQGVGCAGQPSLMRGEFARVTAQHLGRGNPENQFHHGNGACVAEVLKWRYGVFAQPNQPPAIEDLGWPWKRKHGFVKDHNSLMKGWVRAPDATDA